MFIFFFNLLLSGPISEGAKIRKDLLSHPNWRLIDTKEVCGFSSSDRIIGGVYAAPGQYPWMARVWHNQPDQRFPRNDYWFTCGGSVVNNRYILTAAHCVPDLFNYRPYNVFVDLGEYDLNTAEECVGSLCIPLQRFQSEEVFQHPKYDPLITRNDIALIRLERPIVFSHFVEPICLPVFEFFQDATFYELKTAEVIGWGVDDIIVQTITSDVLKTLQTPVRPIYECKRKFGHHIDSTRQLCAGGIPGNNTCRGDSGGPLMIPLALEKSTEYYLVGLVSFGEEYCGTRTPVVYTRVSAYLPWLLDTIRE